MRWSVSIGAMLFAGVIAGAASAATSRPGSQLADIRHIGGSRNRASGGLISVEHPLDLLGVGRLGQRQHQQDTCLLRVKRI